MTHTKKTGNTGEGLAAAWLTGKGYTILERNWRHKHWEVDIIATANDKLHFIEVKTRRSLSFGHPEESIGKRKMQALLSAAQEYLSLHPKWQWVQVDVLAITMLKGKPVEYFLIEDVYF